MDISLFNRNLFLTREFEATKRLNFFQNELSLYLDLGAFDGSSRDKKVVFLQSFLQFYKFAYDLNRKSFSKRQLKDLLDVRGRFLKFSVHLFRCVNMLREKWMIKLHFSSQNFMVILRNLVSGT